MKRVDLIRHIEAHGCRLLREGGNHSVYLNPEEEGLDLFRVIVKSMSFSRARSVVISTFRDLDQPRT